MEWYVNFYVGKKGTTANATPPTIIRVNQDEAVDLPLCINGEMLMFKMELVREAVVKAPTLLGEKKKSNENTQDQQGQQQQQQPQQLVHQLPSLEDEEFHNFSKQMWLMTLKQDGVLNSWITRTPLYSLRDKVRRVLIQLYEDNSYYYDEEDVRTYSLITMWDELCTKMEEMVGDQNVIFMLRLTPYHPDLNPPPPIEMAWAAIKGYLGSKNVNRNISKAIELVKEKAMMGNSEWDKLCQKMKEIERPYMKSDHVVDLVTDQFVIYADEDSESEDDDDHHDDSMSPEPRPGTSSANDLMEVDD
ncbi:hypothetical protein MSG28_012805 [Choristoneura fumiferana]|uniref:Uncharacterized protein n=1 Tax=Choristoneura fumiferana TaxID=7141 RepID=A0ACC0JI47_CHOFU|nr:hypothetical protein MSG28_012805 [Choristoneura fumiferana]